MLNGAWGQNWSPKPLRIKPSFALAWQLKKLITLIFRVHEKSFKFKIFAAKRILGFASGAK
jgi:hypothetical protein